MKEKSTFYDNCILWLVIGLFMTCISSLLFIILGENSIVTYHDQLDGEVLCYIYQAKYLFTDSNIPELMNGVGKSALTAPAPLLVLFYKVLPPFAAFIVSQYFVMVLAFIGMYLILNKWNVNPMLASLCGVLFAYLPLLPVYGLSMYGVPMVTWAFWNLIECEGVNIFQVKGKFISLVTVVLFGVSSSLVLSGFAVLVAAVLVGLVCKSARKSLNYWISVVVLIVTYVLCNLNLVLQILGVGESYVTHKEEYDITEAPFFDTVINVFINGEAHAQSYQKWILLLAVVIIIAGVVKKGWRNRQWMIISSLVGAAMLIAVFCGVFSCAPIVDLRRKLGGVFTWFQFNRIYWLYPAIWYAVLGLELQWMWQLRRWLACSVGAICFVITAITVLLAGNWKDNLKKVLNPDAPGISWNEFFAEDVLAQVDEYIYNTTGEMKEEYRVVSLGICPGAALYNGFFCLDGYSNNYPVLYKHQFRDIIESELAKSEYLTDYYDNWGNRCYLFSAEIPGYYTVEKGGFYFADYSINAEALKELGGKYILSAAYIDKYEAAGLELLREEPFETPDSYYKIYLYGLSD